jgi:hypothetical protein
MRKLLLLILLTSLVSLLNAAEWKPSAELNLRWGLSDKTTVLKPLLMWDHSYINLNGRLNKETTGVIRWGLPTATTATASFEDLFYEAYMQIGESKLGKHHAPFGSYTTRTISDVWTRQFEETRRIGASTRLSYYDVFRVHAGLFNNGANDAMSGFALRTEVIPRPEVVFQQSLLYDQVLDNVGAKVSKVDVAAMAMLDFKGAVVDVDLYRQMAGPYKDATLFNASLQVTLTKQLAMAMRFEWANSVAAAVIDRRIGLIVGVNHKLSPDMTYSVEGQFLTLQNSQSAWVIQNRLSIDVY